MTAREEILGRVRRALADVPGSERPDDTAVTRAYATSADFDVVEVFVERVADYRAEIRRVPPDELPAQVAAALRPADGRVVVARDLPDAWLSAVDAEVIRDDGTLAAAELDRCAAVVTGCAVGIALTGTIVLDGGPAQGRRALSLVPDRHVCIVRADQVVATVPEAVRRLDPRRALTWISGPSATSDIELNRVEGVHGPRTLVVLVVG